MNYLFTSVISLSQRWSEKKENYRIFRMLTHAEMVILNSKVTL